MAQTLPSWGWRVDSSLSRYRDAEPSQRRILAEFLSAKAVDVHDLGCVRV